MRVRNSKPVADCLSPVGGRWERARRGVAMRQWGSSTGTAFWKVRCSFNPDVFLTLVVKLVGVV